MCEYKSLPCISKMKSEYQTMFTAMVEEYGKGLQERIVMNKAAYTLHDFEHHCFNIYKIISYVLFNEELVYQDGYGLTQRELLILNLAVLFHDIGMSKVLGAIRENHSLKSAEYIQREYDDPGRPLRNKCDLTVNEVKALKAIVVAHSNIKDGSVSAKENGLNASNLHDYKSKVGTPIRTKFLAGVLRLADELDVSSERVGTGELEQQIEEGRKHYEKLKKDASMGKNKDEMEEWEGYFASLVHWKHLHLFSGVQRNNDGETIELCIDDDYVERCLDDGQTEKSLAQDIVDIYVEIEKKLKESIQAAFVGKTFGTYVFVKKLNVVTGNLALEKTIKDLLSVRSLSKEEYPNEGKREKETVVTQSGEPCVVDAELEKKIYEEVNKRGLIKFGHYLLNDKFCARDWIDTQDVVETKKILNRLVEAIVKDINSKQHEEYIIVGIDMVGTLLASRIAFLLQRPLSYIVPEREESNSANQEIELDIENDAKVILITDAIVTFDTIQKAVGKYNLDKRIDSIYTIFYRKSDYVKCEADMLSKTYSLNNMFKIELFEKDRCPYKEQQCIAFNQKISEGE